MGRAEAALKRLGSALATEQDTRRAVLPAPSDAERLVSEVVRRDRQRHGVTRGAALALALAAMLAFLVRPRPLSFEVAGVGQGSVGAWISAQAQPQPLSFSDGTVLTLASEARARIVAVERSGARLVLEQGTLSAHVVHREDTQWTIVAGPFEVLVTGTRFDVVWSPASDVFELRLKEGSVTVTGPSLGQGRNVRAGEALRIDVREPRGERGAATAAPSAKPEATPGLEGATPSAADPNMAKANMAEPPAVPSRSVPSPTARRDASKKDAPKNLAAPGVARASSPHQRVLKELRVLAAAGDYSEVARRARANDFAALCREASIEELMLLADAARLSGAPESARDALLSLRERFSTDARAATAAFLLGRIFFEQLQVYPRAARWFSVYLEEQPDGELADDALSRLAEAKALSGDPAGAREAARRYLRRNPTGPQAERAKLLAN